MTKKYNEISGNILSCSGGLYLVETDNGMLQCKARGNFRIRKIKPVSGDKCILRIEENTNEIYLYDIKDRKSFMNRPEIANLDVLYIVFSPCSPNPDLFVVDKLIYNTISAGITPIIVITKSQLNTDLSTKIYNIYSKCFKTFITDSYFDYGIQELKDYILSSDYITCAFSGASGVGKSTLINKMFPYLNLASGELSKKISRGKNTTRTTSLLKIDNNKYIADTPGFTSLSFEFKNDVDSYEKSLNSAFPDISKYLPYCKWRNCTHTKEDGCKILENVENGNISKERYFSYINLLKGEKDNY